MYEISLIKIHSAYKHDPFLLESLGSCSGNHCFSTKICSVLEYYHPFQIIVNSYDRCTVTPRKPSNFVEFPSIQATGIYSIKNRIHFENDDQSGFLCHLFARFQFSFFFYQFLEFLFQFFTWLDA